LPDVTSDDETMPTVSMHVEYLRPLLARATCTFSIRR
jgi:hypothetical protein